MTRYSIKSAASPISRRALVSTAPALPLVTLLSRKAVAATFRVKMANVQPGSHPTSVRMKEAAKRIVEKTDGELQFRFFADGQLGSESDTLSQVRGGALELMIGSAAVLASVVPAVGLVNVGFAFKDYDQVWAALDGGLGTYLRGEISKAGLLPIGPIGANGFRQMTATNKPILTPADLLGFKMRVPVSPIITSLFKSLGAAPTAIGGPELYASLQTGIVDGEENALPIILSSRYFEVQKHCSITDHIFDAMFIFGNGAAIARLPEKLRTVMVAELQQSIIDQRKDMMEADRDTRAVLVGKGLQIHDVDRSAFKAAAAQSSFYADWKARFGVEGWAALESSVGRLGPA